MAKDAADEKQKRKKKRRPRKGQIVAFQTQLGCMLCESESHGGLTGGNVRNIHLILMARVLFSTECGRSGKNVCASQRGNCCLLMEGHCVICLRLDRWWGSTYCVVACTYALCTE